MVLIVDSREPKHLIDNLREVILDVKIDTLNYGDFIVVGANQRFVIERKEIGDLFRSLNDGRFFAQMKGIEQFDGYKKILLLEGSLETAKKWNQSISLARYTGTKVSLMYGWEGITTVTTEDQKETIDFLRRLNEKAGDGQEEQYTRSLGFSKEGRTPNEELVDIMRGVEGIGEQKGSDLLRKFKTVEKVARASLKELTNVLGEKDGEHIWKAFRRRWVEKRTKKNDTQ